MPHCYFWLGDSQIRDADAHWQDLRSVRSLFLVTVKQSPQLWLRVLHCRGFVAADFSQDAADVRCVDNRHASIAV